MDYEKYANAFNALADYYRHITKGKSQRRDGAPIKHRGLEWCGDGGKKSKFEELYKMLLRAGCAGEVRKTLDRDN